MSWDQRVGRRLKLRDLHILMEVATAGTMGKAAERLNISQPVCLETVASLEHTLGVRLLDRTMQGVELTDYGRAALKCGVAVFDELKKGVEEIDSLPIRRWGRFVLDARSLNSPASFRPRSTGCHRAIRVLCFISFAWIRRHYPANSKYGMSIS